ncbi:MAG: alanine dehydrogenase [Gammaproteobacteria bacterium]
MLIGVPKEIKNNEFRVGMTPSAVRELVSHGHQVLVQSQAGVGIGKSDDDYRAAGASIADDAVDVFAQAEMIVKVKEPQPDECRMLREGQLLFTYLHLAPDPTQTDLLIASGCTAIAYETITDAQGGLPLLAPMSEVAGRMAAQVGAVSLQKANGGSGVLLGGVPGTSPTKVMVIGGGVVGINAARMAMGMGADVTILDKSLPRLRHLDDAFGPLLKTRYSTLDAVEELAQEADMIVGAVLIPGAAAPKLISKAMLSDMKPGSVLVDVAIDQGGCFETSHATTHAEPTYMVDGIVHYCVANMPGAVSKTSTFALNNATLPFTVALANQGWREAGAANKHLLAGLNVHAGQVTYQAVAEALGKDYLPAEEALKR